MGASASVHSSLDAAAIAQRLEQLPGDSYGGIVAAVRDYEVDEAMVLSSTPEELFEMFAIEDKIQRGKLKSEITKLREARRKSSSIRSLSRSSRAQDSQADAESGPSGSVRTLNKEGMRSRLFKEVAAEPFCLTGAEFEAWFEANVVEKSAPDKRDVTRSIGVALVDGPTIVECCCEISTTTDITLTRANGKRLPGIQGRHNFVRGELNKAGLHFYYVLYRSCDRRNPLMDLVWEQKLGKGAFGQVHRVKNRHSDTSMALKIIQVDSEEKLEASSKEMAHHQKAAALSEFVVNIPDGGWGQIGDEFLFVLMELCSGGDIRKLLKNADPKDSGLHDDGLRWKLMLQITSGIEAIHASGLIHMDLKPENGA